MYIPEWVTNFFPSIIFAPAQITDFVSPWICTPPPGDQYACIPTEVLSITLFTFLEFSLCGAFIGLLYGKFKNRNLPHNS